MLADEPPDVRIRNPVQHGVDNHGQQLAIFLQDVAQQLNSSLLVLGVLHSGEHVEKGLEPGADTCSLEVRRSDLQVSTVTAEQSGQQVEGTGAATDRLQVLIDDGLGRAGVASPEEYMEKPVQQPVTIRGVSDVPPWSFRCLTIVGKAYPRHSGPDTSTPTPCYGEGGAKIYA